MKASHVLIAVLAMILSLSACDFTKKAEKPATEVQELECTDLANGIRKCHSFLTDQELRELNPKLAGQNEIGITVEQSPTRTLVTLCYLDDQGRQSVKHNPLARLVFPVGKGTQVTTYPPIRLGITERYDTCEVNTTFLIGPFKSGDKACNMGMSTNMDQHLIIEGDPLLDLQMELYLKIWDGVLHARGIHESNIFLAHKKE